MQVYAKRYSPKTVKIDEFTCFRNFNFALLRHQVDGSQKYFRGELLSSRRFFLDTFEQNRFGTVRTLPLDPDHSQKFQSQSLSNNLEKVRNQSIEQVTIDELVQQVTPLGRDKVPAEIKQEILLKLRTFLEEES